ncbi:MAG: hypothetical protein SAK29_40865, partial [Scytonema sp. PMC 1069.18]|nr:hypothetical protein [Scytonema sp. PMC 1069.18]
SANETLRERDAPRTRRSAWKQATRSVSALEKTRQRNYKLIISIPQLKLDRVLGGGLTTVQLLKKLSIFSQLLSQWLPYYSLTFLNGLLKLKLLQLW